MAMLLFFALAKKIDVAVGEYTKKSMTETISFDALVITNISSYLTIHQSNLWLSYMRLTDFCIASYNNLIGDEFIEYFNAIDDHRVTALSTYQSFRSCVTLSLGGKPLDIPILHRLCRLAFSGSGNENIRPMIWWMTFEYPHDYMDIWAAVGEYAITSEASTHLLISDLMGYHHMSFARYILATKDGRYADYCYRIISRAWDGVMEKAGPLFINAHIHTARSGEDIIDLIHRCMSYHRAGHYIVVGEYDGNVYISLTEFNRARSKENILFIAIFYKYLLMKTGAYKKIKRMIWEL